MRQFFPALALLASLLSMANAQPLDLTLIHTDIDSLPEEARSAYARAATALDHADHIDAVNALADAAEAAPDATELQTLFIDAAELYYQIPEVSLEDAVSMGERAVAAHSRILDHPDLPDWAVAEDTLRRDRIEAILSNIGEIYNRRLEESREIVRRLSVQEGRIGELHQRHLRNIHRDGTPPESGRVNSEDAVDANPRLLPQEHPTPSREGVIHISPN